MKTEIDINKQCQKIYEEIEDTRKKLHLDLKTLFSKSFHQMDLDDHALDHDEKKYYEKYRKIFQRKSWKEGKAKKQTRNSLEKLREAIYRTDEYGKIESVILTFDDKKKLKKISEKLETILYSQDYEE